jgi:hypothetical protein
MVIRLFQDQRLDGAVTLTLVFKVFGLTFIMAAQLPRQATCIIG